jgi:hypothetical protein
LNFQKVIHPPRIFSAMIRADAAPLLPHPKTGAIHVASIGIDPAPFVPQDGRFPNDRGWAGAHPGDGNRLIRWEAIR